MVLISNITLYYCSKIHIDTMNMMSKYMMIEVIVDLFPKEQ